MIKKVIILSALIISSLNATSIYFVSDNCEKARDYDMQYLYFVEDNKCKQITIGNKESLYYFKCPYLKKKKWYFSPKKSTCMESKYLE